MADVLRPDIRDAVIFRADLPTGEPRRVSDAQLDTLISRSLRRLGGILESFHSEDYRQFSLPFGLASGSVLSVGQYPKIVHVMWRIVPAGSTVQPQYLRLDRMNEQDLENRGDGTQFTQRWSKDQPPKWRVSQSASSLNHDTELSFSPASPVTESMLFVFTQDWEFTDDTTPVNISYGWEEWIVLDCLIAIRQRDKQDASDVTRERERTEQRIREQAAERFLDDRLTVIDRDPGFQFGTRFPLRTP